MIFLKYITYNLLLIIVDFGENNFSLTTISSLVLSDEISYFKRISNSQNIGFKFIFKIRNAV